MALRIEQIVDKYESLRVRYAARDQRMADITAVRRGDMESVYPDMFPEGISKPMIANFIDVAARDLAEVLAPLPSFNCSTVNVNSDKAKRNAEIRSRIASNYVQFSALQTQMYTGADWYLTYAFLPVVVEPDFDNNMPRIRVESPMGAYPEFDRYGRIVSYSKRYKKSIRELIVEFPEYEGQILGRYGRENTDMTALMDLVRYEDKDQIVMFLPQQGNMSNDLALSRAKNLLGRVSVAVARRPGIDPDDPRGQFDDVIWAQIARARFSLLAMEAAEKSVQAPLVVPNDLQEFAFGPDAVIRTANPAGVRRVGLELPTGAFTEQQVLENEMRMGSRYPEGRSGQIDASIITGSGVQALLGGFDSQIKAGQQILAEMFEQVIAICFQMDEVVFPEEKKTRGTINGAQYELQYNPKKDIAGDYSVNVRYGLMSGLDPSRALIFSLQALQANLVSEEFIMQELPWSMNVSEERDRIDIERLRGALNGAIGALSQAIPQMAAQGQDPSDIVEKIAKVIDKRRRGIPIEEAAMDIFEKPEPVEQPQTPEAPEMDPMAAMLAAQQASPGMGAPVEAAAQESMMPSPAPVAAPPGGNNTAALQEVLARLGAQ